MIKAKDNIYKITPYIGGESTAKDGQRIIKLSSNEGPFGPPPLAVAAMQEAAKEISRYPDGGCHALRDALAQKNNCLLYTSPSPRDQRGSRMPSSA